jgi:ADP-heptose:LPS heptosyltransferase
MGEYAFFLVSWLLWRLWFRRRSLPSWPKAVLVVKLDHLGDAILATPALRNLRRHYPDARLDVLCARWNRAAFETSPYVDRLLQFNPRTFCRGAFPDSPGRSWRALRALGGEYDLVLSLRGTWLTLLLARRCWVDRGAARVEMRLRRRTLATHETDIVLSLLEFSGIPVRHSAPEYTVPDAESRLAADLLTELGLAAARVVALHVGSPLPAKRWPPDRFAALADGIAANGARVLLIGAKEDAPLAERVRRAASTAVTDLTGKTRLPVTAALLQRCACFVGNDSAPMHLAAVVGTPCVGLFFASDPARFGPRGAHVRVLSRARPEDLSLDEVLDAVRDMWRPAVTSPSREGS